MKPKNIEKHLKLKFDDWLKSIEDEKVRGLVARDTICMGGAIASLLLGEKVNDYDFYFQDRRTCLAVAEYYVQKFKENPPPKFRGDVRDLEIFVKDDDGRIRIVVKSAGVASEEQGEAGYAYFESDPDSTDQEAFLDVALHVLETDKEKDIGPTSIRVLGLSTHTYNALARAAVGTIEQLSGILEDIEYKTISVRGLGEKSLSEAKRKLAAYLEEHPPSLSGPYRPIFLSSNAITLSDGIQLVTRFYGNPTDIRENYDFIHVTNYWTSWGGGGRGKLFLRKDALIALMTKELQVINGGTKYPFAAICRIRKFTTRGFHITAGHILKLCLAISELDFRDYNVLQEQLTGVDLAYFTELLSYLDAHKNEWVDEEENKLKTPYLLELIDRLL